MSGERFNMEFMIKNGYVESPVGSGIWKKGKIEESKPKKHKYNAKAKMVDGVRYDSQREFSFKTMLDFNQIAYNMKEVYELQPEFISMGEKIRAIRIIPDFTVYNRFGRIAIIDIKGVVLPDFLIKTKMLKRKLVFELKQDIPIIMPTNKEAMTEAIRLIQTLIK